MTDNKDNSFVKKYRLLKDYSTPDLIAKAGEIGEQKPSLFYDENCKVWFDNGRYFFYLSQIKMHPSWFEELHKCQYCEAWTSQPDSQCYKAPESKSPEPCTNKGWEIVYYGYIQNNENKPEQQYIHSVKRLSDGEVFTVGDKVYYEVCGKKDRVFDIAKFHIWEDKSIAVYDANDNPLCKLESLFKEPTTPIQPSTDTPDKSEKEEKQWYWDNEVMKNKPTDTPVKERIEISGFFDAGAGLSNYSGERFTTYSFNTKSKITTDKFPAIKQAIEAVLNEDTVVGICQCENSMDSYLDDKNNFICKDCDKPYSKTDTVVQDKPEKVSANNDDVACLTANEVCGIFTNWFDTDGISFRNFVNKKVNEKLK